MSNPTPPAFNYANLSYTMALVGNQLVFTFTVPPQSGLPLSNPIYINAVELTIMKDRFNPNLVQLGDDKGVYTVNYLLQLPPAGSLNAFINSILALVPVVPPLPSLAFIADKVYNAATTYPEPYTAVVWDNIIQNSTDVTYNPANGEFTVNVESDYMIDYRFTSRNYYDVYCVAVRDEVANTNLDLALCSITTPVFNAQFGIIPPYNGSLWGDSGATAQIDKTFHFAAGDVFSLGIFVDPNVYGVATLNEGRLNVLPSLITCSVKRWPTV